MAAHHRHVARIVEDPIFLFVSRIMFFIDNDQPQFLEGQKERRPRPCHNPHRALGNLPPDALPGAGGKVGMPFGRLCPETIMEPVEKLLCQRDFRQENQHLLALLDRLGNGFEINLGLARSGHAIEQ